MSDILITTDPIQGGFRLEAHLDVPGPRANVFAFFSDAFQLEAITPPWMHFHVATPAPLQIHAGTLIDYKLRIHGLPLRWRSRISVWEPPVRFVDEMLRGPYRRWHHEHRFEEIEGGTRVHDIVHYDVPGGRLIHALLVRRDLRKIFDFRTAKLREILGAWPANRTMPG